MARNRLSVSAGIPSFFVRPLQKGMPALSNLIKNTTALLLLAVAFTSGWAGEAKTKILFIGKNPDHPHGTHMYMHTCGVLAKCAELTPGIETVVSNGWPKDAKTLAGVKSIVIYTSPAAELLLEGPHRNDVDQLMKKGVGLVTIHWASSVNQKNFEQLGPTWLSYLGGTWVSNVGLSGGKSPLKQLIPEHPICRGWKEYEIEDEFYLNPTIKQAKPLLQVTRAQGQGRDRRLGLRAPRRRPRLRHDARPSVQELPDRAVSADDRERHPVVGARGRAEERGAGEYQRRSVGAAAAEVAERSDSTCRRNNGFLRRVRHTVIGALLCSVRSCGKSSSSAAPFAVDALSAALAANGVSASLATIYRTLRTLEKVDMVRRQDGTYQLL